LTDFNYGATFLSNPIEEHMAMSERFYKNLGEKIKVLREQMGFSQEELAQRIHINRVSLSQIENGERKISAEELSHLSQLFNVSTDILLNLRAKLSIDLIKESLKAPEKQELRISVPQKKLDKFKEVLIYILDKVGSKSNVGETVLYKLLYFIDFDFYEKYEEQLVGATYIKNHHGPTPVEFKKIIDSMEGKDLVRIKDQYFQYPQTKYLPLRQPDLSKFNAHEIKLIDEVLEKLSNYNANQISEYSHGDVPWVTTEMGEVIDYETVFYRQKPYSVRSYDDVQADKATS
jgi:transcriptional regulator with XRE-family HTH domain